jgi:hypothetical protein
VPALPEYFAIVFSKSRQMAAIASPIARPKIAPPRRAKRVAASVLLYQRGDVVFERYEVAR